MRAAARQADALELGGVRWTVGLGEQLGRPRLPDSPLQGAVDTLGRAVVAWRLRFYDPRISPWELMTMITGGGLLRGRPRDPPGFCPPVRPRQSRRWPAPPRPAGSIRRAQP